MKHLLTAMIAMLVLVLPLHADEPAEPTSATKAHGNHDSLVGGVDSDKAWIILSNQYRVWRNLKPACSSR